MPVLDTVVLFGAADPRDPIHEKSLDHLTRLEQPEYYLASFALVEFDIVMKSRGFTYGERMERHALLARDFPAASIKTRAISPQVLHLAASIEGEAGIDYFDACVAAEAKAQDGIIVSTDGVFNRLKGIRRRW